MSAAEAVSRSPHLVLVPGLTCTAELFSPQIAALRAHVGVSVADHSKHDSVAAIAAAILAAAPRRFALCGLSMGGYIAFEMLRQAPERIERVALLDTAAGPDSAAQRARRLRLIAMARGGKYKEVSIALWPLYIHPDRHEDTALKAVVLRMIAETGAETFIRQQSAIMSRADSRPSLARIKCPALVLVGAQDALTPPAEAEAIAAGIDGARLVSVPDCGHLSTLERPAAVNRALADWLDW